VCPTAVENFLFFSYNAVDIFSARKGCLPTSAAADLGFCSSVLGGNETIVHESAILCVSWKRVKDSKYSAFSSLIFSDGTALISAWDSA
jgi:hypothetical protein